MHSSAAAAAAFLTPAVAASNRLVPLRRARFFAVRAVASPPASKPSSSPSKTGKWQWTFEDKPISVYYEEHEQGTAENVKNILMIPTISDVSTVEEWRVVAKDIVAREGEVNYRATIVDWPGLGYSDRPSLNYNADVMENFLVQLINSPNSPVTDADGDLVVIGGGHAATIAVRAAGKGLIKPSAVAAVAPTWAGPLPIVFGRGSDMETRYGLLRGTLRAPAIGWMMYNLLVSNEKSIKSQYKSHVYGNPENVTPYIIESRYELTKRNGARFVPAAFLTGLLDPVQSREEFLQLFAKLDGDVPVLVVSTLRSPRRSKAEMEALKGAKGVTKFVEVPGALLPQEEYPLSPWLLQRSSMTFCRNHSHQEDKLDMWGEVPLILLLPGNTWIELLVTVTVHFLYSNSKAASPHTSRPVFDRAGAHPASVCVKSILP